MAGAGYKAFADGDVLTAAQVQGYLQDQAVMKFADSSARTTALGTAVAEGMMSYLADTDAVEFYNGSAWTALGGFTASTAITATDASWPVPTLADPVVKVTVIGGGGAGAAVGGNGGDGSASSFACAAGTATASGGQGGNGTTNSSGRAGTSGLASGNGGRGAIDGVSETGAGGAGGVITVAYLDLTGVTTANVTVGAGGVGNSADGETGGSGGNGAVIFEYRAG